MAPTQTIQTPLAQIRDLESQFAAAMTQMYAVGNGLAQVRQDLADDAMNALPAPVAPVREEPANWVDIHAAPAPGDTTVPPSPPTPPTASSPTGPRWWERPGAVAKVLGAVGAVVTLIGVAFLLAIAIAAGIFGPVPRTVSGALLAAGLIAGGVVVRRRSGAEDRPTTQPTRITGGEALAATGLAAAYLDLLAATALYDFIPGSIGLILAGALSVGAFLLARRWNSELLAILAAAPPMLLAPALTGLSLMTLSFVALLLVGSAFAHLGHEWRWLYLARTAPAVPIVLLGALLPQQPFPIITLTAAMALGMVLAGVAEQSRRLEQLPMYAALAAAIPLTLVVADLGDGRLPVAASLGTLFLAVAAFMEWLTGRIVTSRWVWVAPLVTGTLLLMIAAGALPTESQSGTALAVVSGAYLLVGAWRNSRPVAAMSILTGVTSAVLFVPTALATASEWALTRTLDPMMIVHGLALTVLAGVAHLAGRALADDERASQITRGACVAAFVTGSATVVLIGTLLGDLWDEPTVGFYGGHAVATALWTALAAVLMTVVARRSRDRGLMVRVGLGLVAVAVGKLFLFDLSALSGLFRVVAFVVTGVIVLVLGVAVAREQTKAPEARAPQAIR